MSLGGFGGHDPVFSTERLADLGDEGAVRFFLMQDGERRNRLLLGWIKDNCEKVPQELWQSSTFNQAEGLKGKAVLLYDCDAGAL